MSEGTYNIRMRCGNCGHRFYKNVPMGIEVKNGSPLIDTGDYIDDGKYQSIECPKCGCRTCYKQI